MTIPIPHVPPGAPISEIDFMEQLRRALNAPDRQTRVWRVNVGSVVIRDRSGRAKGRFQAGPPPGAADLSGVATVSRKWLAGDGSVREGALGIRLEVEVKTDTKQSDEQKAYESFMTRAGCVYVLVKYDHSKTLEQNVADGVAKVDAAIAERVAASG